MARVFITGSSDGLGLMAARLLIDQGRHQRLRAPNPVANDIEVQEEFLAECGRISGVPLVDQPTRFLLRRDDGKAPLRRGFSVRPSGEGR